MENKIKKVIKSYLKMMLLSIVTVIVGLMLAFLINHFHHISLFWINFLESLGYVCWGTSLGASSKFRSRTDHSAELFNHNFNTFISLMGILAFSMAQILRPPH